MAETPATPPVAPPVTHSGEVEISTVNAAASQFRVTPVEAEADFHSAVSEFAANVAGSLSPFGDDVEFPLPSENLGYRHPRPVNRPALAGD